MSITYHGSNHRTGTGGFLVEKVDHRGVDVEHIGPLEHHVRHSPDGFAWGYHGSGPSELARCLLLDAVGDEAGYQDFKREVVARWPMHGNWTITAEEIQAWADVWKGART